MERYILTIDEGTTSTRAIIVNQECQIIASERVKFAHYYPHEGWVEQDPNEIWNAVRTTLINVLNKQQIQPSQIEAIGLTNQREAVVVWNKETGLPIYNVIGWQDKRPAEWTKDFSQKEVDLIREKTGLFLNPYFSAPKIRWILDNVPGARKLAEAGKLQFGTINTWIISCLTGGKIFITDRTNAQRTLLYNIQTNDWDPELLAMFKIPVNMLPKIKSNSEIYGQTFSGFFSKSDKTQIKIASSIGDQQSALFGQLATNKGDTKVTYGTGSFMIMNTGQEKVWSQSGLLTTVVSDYQNEIKYGIEGSVLICGSAIEWLRDSLRIIYNALESEWYSGQVTDERQVYVVPAFSGLGSPYWDDYARGAIFGLDSGTRREHLVRATLEAIAYQVNDVLNAMSQDLQEKFKSIKVDGGVSNNKFLLQFQANISQTEVIKPKNIEATAMGATYLAGLAVGFWKDLNKIKKYYEVDYRLVPEVTTEVANNKIKGWRAAVERTFNWLKVFE